MWMFCGLSCWHKCTESARLIVRNHSENQRNVISGRPTSQLVSFVLLLAECLQLFSTASPADRITAALFRPPAPAVIHCNPSLPRLWFIFYFYKSLPSSPILLLSSSLISYLRVLLLTFIITFCVNCSEIILWSKSLLFVVVSRLQ